jgi:hypothetical protein
LELPGTKLLFGAKELPNHKIPKEYGAVEPTAIFVPLELFKGVIPCHSELNQVD